MATRPAPSLATTRTNRVDRVTPYTLAGSATCAWVADAQLEPGKRQAPSHSRPGLVALLEGLPPDARPQFVRSDIAFGNDGEMAVLEALKQSYLVKLRQSPGVMKLSSRQWNLDGWTDVGQGWTGREDTLRLMGWSKERRVVVIRRARRIDIEDAGKTKVKRRGRKSNPHKQAELALIDQNEATKNWEYAVLVCDMPYTGRCKRREFRPVGVGRDRRQHGQCARQRADLRPGQEQADRWSRS